MDLNRPQVISLWKALKSSNDMFLAQKLLGGFQHNLVGGWGLGPKDFGADPGRKGWHEF